MKSTARRWRDGLSCSWRLENTRRMCEPAYVCDPNRLICECGWHFNLPVNLTHTQPSCWCSLPSLMWECVAQKRSDPVEREGVMAQGWGEKKFNLVVICLRCFNKIHWENNSSLALLLIFWPECDVGSVIGDVKTLVSTLDASLFQNQIGSLWV